MLYRLDRCKVRESDKTTLPDLAKPSSRESDPLPGNSKCIDGGTGVIDNLRRQRVAVDRKLAEAVGCAGRDNVGLAGSRRVLRSTTATHSKMRHSIHIRARVVVVVPTKQDGHPILQE